MVERYDAVVVGGGHNGLVAAITLAESGRSVLVCEAADRLGGAVATEELTRPGFLHDTFSSVYPASVASPVLTRMPLDRHGLEWVHPPVAMAHPLADGRAATLDRDLDATARQLDRLSPGDGAAWARFAEPWLGAFSALRHVMLGGFPPIDGAIRLAGRVRLRGLLDFARLLLQPAEALASELFSGDGARAWLYGSVLHGDVPPRESGSAIAGVYLILMGHAVGWPSPRGGAARLPEALAGHLRDLGGQARTGARVDRVITRRGRCVGVRLQDGTAIRADTVVADVTPGGLLRLAGDAFPASYTTRLERFRPGPGTFKVDWALDGPVPWEAEDVRRAGTVHVGGGSDEINLATAQRQVGALPDRPFLLFGQQSLADPSRAPAGCHTAWAYTRVPPGIRWAQEAAGFADRIEAQVERFAPGFRERILDRHLLTPGDLAARDANLEGGDVGGGSYALDQVVFRPVPSLTPYRTPVRGLYIGSASAFPGGAVHGIPGHAAARMAIIDAALRRLW